MFNSLLTLLNSREALRDAHAGGGGAPVSIHLSRIPRARSGSSLGRTPVIVIRDESGEPQTQEDVSKNSVSTTYVLIGWY